jgi:hypothetical protein
MRIWTNLTVDYGDTSPCPGLTGALRRRHDGGSTLRIQWPGRNITDRNQRHEAINVPFSEDNQVNLKIAVHTLQLRHFEQPNATSTHTLPIPNHIALGELASNVADSTAFVASVDSLLTNLHDQHGPLKMRSLKLYLGRDASPSHYRQVIDIASTSRHTIDEIQLGTRRGRGGPSLCDLVSDQSLLSGLPPGKFTFRVDDTKGSGYDSMEGKYQEDRSGPGLSSVSLSPTVITFRLKTGNLAEPDKLVSGLKVHSPASTFRFTSYGGRPFTAYTRLIQDRLERVSESASASQTS